MPLPGKKTSVILQSVTVGQGASGDPSITTATIATFNATFNPIRASESLQFDKETVTATHVMRVDYSVIGATAAASLVEKNQIVVDSVTYDITGVVRWNTAPSDHYRVHVKKTDVSQN